MIKKIAIISLLMALMSSGLSWLFLGYNLAITAFIGHFLLVVNLLGMYLIWSVLVKKKSIALGVGLILFKYPILGYVVVKLAKQNWFNSFGVFLGFFTFLLSIVLVTVLKHFKKLNKDEHGTF